MKFKYFLFFFYIEDYLLNVDKKVKNKFFLNDDFQYIKTRHSFHLVNPSPWSLISALGAFMLTTGGVLYMYKFVGGERLLLTGLFVTLYWMYMWWRDVIREATFEEQHTFAVQRGLRLGMILFIVSEIMFFFAFFLVFFHLSLAPVFNIGSVWPLEEISPMATLGVSLTNTFFLLSSGATVIWVHYAIIIRAKRQVLLIFTLVLVVLFTSLQIFEYIEVPFNISGTKFFSCLTCDAPENWEIGMAKSNEKFSDFELGVLFLVVFGLIIFMVYVIRRFYLAKKRRTLLTVVLDIYIKLSITLLNRILPRRFTFMTLGFGSVIVRYLFAYKCISLKLAIILMFIVPSISFMFFLGLIMLPFYLAGGYPTTFGKVFFEFLKRNASEASFELLIHKEPHKKVIKPSLPTIQKRHYRATARINSILQDFLCYVAKLPPIENVKHANDLRVIRDAIISAYVEGPWGQMSRKFPVRATRIMMEQGHACPLRAEVLACEATLGRGPFAQFKFPRGPIQLNLENAMNDSLGFAEKPFRIRTPLQRETARLFAEFATNEDYLFSVGLIGLSGIGMLFCNSYRSDPVFRSATEAYLEAGRTLDSEGNLLYPPVKEIIVQDEVSLSSSSLTEDDSDADHSAIFARKFFDPNRIFPDLEDNQRFLNQIKRSHSESDLSSVSDITFRERFSTNEESSEISEVDSVDTTWEFAQRYKNIFRW